MNRDKQTILTEAQEDLAWLLLSFVFAFSCLSLFFGLMVAVCFVPLREVNIPENHPPTFLVSWMFVKEVPQLHHVKNFNSFIGEEEITNTAN